MKNGWKFSSIDFPRQWLKEAVTQCRTVGGLLHFLRNEGGLHPRFTDVEASDDIPLEAFIRMEVGKAMLQDQPIFMKQWQTLGERIYSFGNEHGDEFNKQCKRKKQDNATIFTI